MENLYLAVIGDIVSSRTLPERGKTQEKLKAVLTAINQDSRFASALAAKFTVTIGDEFQGLFSEPANLFEILDKIQSDLWPVEIRLGLGIGTMSTELELYSVGADGPAFWNARAAIETVHSQDDFGYTNISLSAEEAEGLTDIGTGLLNDTLALMCFARNKWTGQQRKVMSMLLENEMYQEDFRRKDVADLLGITPSALVKRVKAGGLVQYLRCGRRIEQMLRETFWQHENNGETVNQ